MNRAVVTGVAGFIGSHLAEALLRRGWEIVGVDNMLDYYPRELKEWNLHRLREHPRFHWFETDVRAFPWQDWVDATTTVFHLAAQPGVRRSWGQRFRDYIEHNIAATQAILEALKTRRPQRLIFASTSSVYGQCPEIPFRENGPLLPISPYGVTKLTAEHLVRMYGEQYDIPYVILRYFTVYGPRQRPDMAFYRFMYAIRSGRSVRIYGDGRQTRDFTYVGDAVDATIRAALYAPNRAVYNIGGGTRASVRTVLGILAQITGRTLKFEWAPPAPGDMRDTWADIRRAVEDFGYTPQTSLSEGLTRQWEWFCRMWDRKLVVAWQE